MKHRCRSSLTTRLVACGALAVAAGVGSAATLIGSAQAAGQGFVWPEFHNTANLHGNSSDPGISTANAASLGVKWMIPVGPSLDSPVTAFNGSLGKTLVYTGGLNGYFDAVDAATGQIVWSRNLGVQIQSSPLVEGNNVWISPKSGVLYKLDATTGATECTAPVKDGIESSPVIATPPGGTPTVYFAAVGTAGNAPVYAINEATCAPQPSFNFHGYTHGLTVGTWAPLSYAVSAKGEGLLIWGTTNPDSAVYAADAVTGQLVWRFQTFEPPNLPDWDVGAGVTTTAPGVNGFAGGVAYVVGKDGFAYALNLTNGTMIWDWNFGGNGPGKPQVQTNAENTPALLGRNLVFAETGEVFDVDAITGVPTGTPIWQHNDATSLIDASTTIVGPTGQEVVTYSNFNGVFHVLSLRPGQQVNPTLFAYKTGGFVDSTAADAHGNLYVVSDDGFLYDFAPGGGNSASPSTAVTSPANGASIPNPGPTIVIRGTASAPDGVSAVNVEIERNPSSFSGQRWWDQRVGLFDPGMALNQATLGSPGATTTTWSITVNVPKAGTDFDVFASAVDATGVADVGALGDPPTSAFSHFTVQAG
jgi:outer membrane protein assembly factor BamB